MIVGEVRNQEAKLVSFFSVDAVSGTPRFEDKTFSELWWMGIEDVAQDVLLLHKFAAPDLPEHKGLVAVDLLTGAQKWAQDDVTYWFVFENSVFAHKTMFDKRVAYELDLQTGTILAEYGQDAEHSLLDKRLSALGQNEAELVFPSTIEPEAAGTKESTMIKKELPRVGIRGNVEFLTVADHLLFDYYVANERSTGDVQTLNNYFKILDIPKGKVIYADILSRDARVALSDSFFVRGNVAYYVKNQKTLTAVKLAG
jgi:hypothetical protein